MGLGIVRRLFNGSRVSFLSKAIGDIICDRTRKEKDVLFDSRNLRAQRIHAPIAHIDTVDEDMALVNVINAVDELRQCTFARACLPHNGNSLAWFSPEGDIFQNGSVAIAKGDIFKDDLSAHFCAIAILVFVELCLFLQNCENTIGSCYT